MRTPRQVIRLLGAVAILLGGPVFAADPGKESIGSLRAEVIFATDGDPAVLGRSVEELAPEEQARLEKSIRRTYKAYRKLGRDEKPILRGYENWVAPMTGSEELMVSFEPGGRVGKDALRLDMEFWQSKRKVLKSGVVLRKGKQVCIVGPKWRGGRLIIVVELINLISE